MARKPHGLLLLFEGLPATVIQSQVFARLAWLDANGIATFDVLAFAHSRDMFDASAARAAGLGGTTGGIVAIERSVQAAIPASRWINRLRLNRWLAAHSNRYDFIQARTDYSAAVAGPLAQSLAIPMIWDCRGDAEGEFRERWAGRSHNALVEWRARQNLREGTIAARTCHTASFVSKPLAAKWLDALGGKPHVVIPCLADETIFHFDPTLRHAERARYGYAPDDVVFVYSGSLAPYQGFDQMAQWFSALVTRLPVARLLVVTPQQEQARARLAAFVGNATVVQAPFNAVNHALNAADYALMLRPESLTNTAAFPTKFAEYGLAGLKVVLSPSVPDCHEIAAAAGNFMSRDTPPSGFHASTSERPRIMHWYRAHLTHKAVADRSRSLYSLGAHMR